MSNQIHVMADMQTSYRIFTFRRELFCGSKGTIQVLAGNSPFISKTYSTDHPDSLTLYTICNYQDISLNSRWCSETESWYRKTDVTWLYITSLDASLKMMSCLRISPTIAISYNEPLAKRRRFILKQSKHLDNLRFSKPRDILNVFNRRKFVPVTNLNSEVFKTFFLRFWMILNL